jgi:hypothetical protein
LANYVIYGFRITFQRPGLVYNNQSSLPVLPALSLSKGAEPALPALSVVEGEAEGPMALGMVNTEIGFALHTIFLSFRPKQCGALRSGEICHRIE